MDFTNDLCARSLKRLNFAGHIKTVIILMGGCMFFGDEMPPKKLFGISVAMAGIMWYSQVLFYITSRLAAIAFPFCLCLSPRTTPNSEVGFQMAFYFYACL